MPLDVQTLLSLPGNHILEPLVIRDTTLPTGPLVILSSQDTYLSRSPRQSPTSAVHVSPSLRGLSHSNEILLYSDLISTFIQIRLRMTRLDTLLL